MIRCPSCQGQSEIRDFKEVLNGVLRKRRCIQCGGSWETLEITVDKIQKLVRQNRKAIQNATEAFNIIDNMLQGFQRK